MNALLATLILAATADALVASRGGSCCFHLTAAGAVTGTLGQLDDGQNRVNGPLAAAQYCIAGSAITDSKGRGCWFTRKKEVAVCVQLQQD